MIPIVDICYLMAGSIDSASISPAQVLLFAIETVNSSIICRNYDCAQGRDAVVSGR